MTRSPSTFKSIVFATALVLSSFASANASDQDKALVKIPFPFTANHIALPAGQYWVLSSDTSISLLDAKTRKTQAILLVRHETGDAIETRGQLTFTRGVGRYVLTDVRFAGSQVHSCLQQRPKLRETPTDAMPTIQIAMK
jgi:hypothetical protein